MTSSAVLLLVGLARAASGDYPTTPWAVACPPPDHGCGVRALRAAGRLRVAPLPVPLTPAAHPLSTLPHALTAEPAKNAIAPLAQPSGNRAGIAFMAAGGALFLAGALIGGDAGAIVMVSGAGVGAYGIYVYLR